MSAVRKQRAKKGRDAAGTRDLVQRQVDEWNARAAIGDQVRYWHVLPIGPTTDTTVKSEAFVASCGEPCLFVTHVGGYVSLNHVRLRSDLAPDAPAWEFGHKRTPKGW